MWRADASNIAAVYNTRRPSAVGEVGRVVGTGRAGLRARRAQLLATAEGRVLEIGAGTGANLAFCDERVEAIAAAEPESPMTLTGRLERCARGTPVPKLRGSELLELPHGPLVSSSCEGIAQNAGPLQLGVFRLELAQPLHIRHRRTTVLAQPLEGRLADPVLSQQVRRSRKLTMPVSANGSVHVSIQMARRRTALPSVPDVPTDAKLPISFDRAAH